MSSRVPSRVLVEPRWIRDVLGHFLSGVTVITAIFEGKPVGFTCQSFSSLSLDPPMVSFAPSRGSTSWPRVRQATSFCVNVLAEDQRELSNAFARSGTDKFAGQSWHPSSYGSPVFEGVAAFIDAELWAEYDGGDHTIVAATVLDLGADSSRPPLAFHRGNYGLRAGEAADPAARSHHARS
jgi:flavin reductase (DIM6/NTAB) family NADH-FMN oxidoreductase RutF